MTTSIFEIEERFEKQLRSIEELTNFDRLVLDLCINHIEHLNENLLPATSNELKQSRGRCVIAKEVCNYIVNP